MNHFFKVLSGKFLQHVNRSRIHVFRIPCEAILNNPENTNYLELY